MDETERWILATMRRPFEEYLEVHFADELYESDNPARDLRLMVTERISAEVLGNPASAILEDLLRAVNFVAWAQIIVDRYPRGRAAE